MVIFRKRNIVGGLRRLRRNAADVLTDMRMDRKFRPALQAFRASADYAAVPPATVLVIGVQSPKRGNSLAAIFARMASDRHRVEFLSCGVGTLSKPENSNALLASADLDRFDYVITTDDDITLPDRFIDDLIAIVHIAALDIAGPAQRRRSYFNLDITRRCDTALARRTNYVEVGPLVIFRRRTFEHVFPFPVTKYGWAIDLLWSKIADERGWQLGIVDATPIRHLSPAGSNYDWAAAQAEMHRFRAANGITLSVSAVAVHGHALPIT